MLNVYLDDIGYCCGERISIEELKKQDKIKGNLNMYMGEGYKYARVLNRDKFAFIDDAISIGEEAELLIYHKTFYDSWNDKIDNRITGEKNYDLYLENDCEQILKNKKRIDMSYIGLNQQGCTGLLSNIQIAWAKVLSGSNNTIYCLCDDVLPTVINRESETNKMVLSDTISFATISTSPSPWLLLNILEVSVINETIFGIMNKVYCTICLLCEGFVDLREIENFIFPNHWRKVWKQFLERNHLSSRSCESTISELAHGLSADIISNLILFKKKKLISSQKKQILVSCGYGGHLRCALIEAQ